MARLYAGPKLYSLDRMTAGIIKGLLVREYKTLSPLSPRYPLVKKALEDMGVDVETML